MPGYDITKILEEYGDDDFGFTAVDEAEYQAVIAEKDETVEEYKERLQQVEKIIMPFSMLLNLVGSSNADNKEILWKFINRFHQEIKPKDYPILDGLTEFAINYFKDKVEPNKKFKKPSSGEKKALENLVLKFSEIKENLKPEELQTIVYATGKENGYEQNLRDWFKLIYEVVFGEENGPRMGYFVSFFGLKETIELMKDKISNN